MPGTRMWAPTPTILGLGAGTDAAAVGLGAVLLAARAARSLASHSGQSVCLTLFDLKDLPQRAQRILTLPLIPKTPLLTLYPAQAGRFLVRPAGATDHLAVSSRSR